MSDRKIIDRKPNPRSVGVPPNLEQAGVYPMEFRECALEGWRSPEQVEWLEIGDEELGRGSFGIVYRGRIKFQGAKSTHVAVKRLKEELRKEHTGTGMSDELAVQYQRCICDLRAEGVRMPHLSMLKADDGEWVMVMEAFERGHHSKFDDNVHAFNSDASRGFYARTLAGIVNARYYPVPDAFQSVNGGEMLFLLDLDEIARHRASTLGEVHGNIRRAVEMIRYVEMDHNISAPSVERHRLRDEMLSQFQSALRMPGDREYAAGWIAGLR